MCSPRRAPAIAALLALLFSFAAQAEPRNLLTAQQWRQDLQTLAAQIVKEHPGAFHAIGETEFRAAVASLDAKVPSLSDSQIEVELIRLVALLGEGHSRLSLPGLPDAMSDVPDLTPVKDPRLAFHRLPVRLYTFSDGLFVVDATADYRALVGSQVLAIGGWPTQDVLAAVRPLVNRDNDMGALLIGPQLAVVPEVLQAVHVVDDASRVTLALKSADGKDSSVSIAPLATGAEPQWAGPGGSTPLYLRRADENLWLEYLADSRTVFVKINVLQNSKQQTVAQFARALGALADSHPVDRVAIDFRGCHGGDNQKFRALLLEITRDANLNQLGKLFVITDRASFSAAVNAVGDLERLANVILIGEPTAGAPGSWGDPKRIELPNSGLVARISSIYWSDWMPGASRPWIAPDIATPLSSADYFAGRDPALDAILHFPSRAEFGDILEYLAANGAGLGTIERLYYQHKTDPLWAGDSTEAAMQRVGAQLVAARSYRDALTVFEINFAEYPTSLADALQTVHAAQAASPHDDGLDGLTVALERLKATH
jgi:hypothetical protein